MCISWILIKELDLFINIESWCTEPWIWNFTTFLDLQWIVFILQYCMEVHQIFLRAKHIRFMHYFVYDCHRFDSLCLGGPAASNRSGSAAERKQSYAYDRGQVPTATWAKYFTVSSHRAAELTITFHAVCRFYLCNKLSGRSRWPRDLRRRSTAARLLRSWVRIPPGAWMFVCCECCVLSGRGLWHELITRPEESYRLCCVVVCDLETSRMGAPYIYMTLVA